MTSERVARLRVVIGLHPSVAFCKGHRKLGAIHDAFATELLSSERPEHLLVDLTWHENLPPTVKMFFVVWWCIDESFT